ARLDRALDPPDPRGDVRAPARALARSYRAFARSVDAASRPLARAAGDADDLAAARGRGGRERDQGMGARGARPDPARLRLLRAGAARAGASGAAGRGWRRRRLIAAPARNVYSSSKGMIGV